MANRYFLNIGANWGDTANWSDTSGGTGGFSVPTNADDVFFDANSGNCTVNASNRVCKTLNFTGYTNTITMTFIVSISGSLTLSSTMTIAGTSRVQLLATGTITTNGKTWPNDILTANTITLTLADDININGLLTINGATTINGTFNINANGGVTLDGANIIKGTGTPKLYFKGSTIQSTSTSGRCQIDSYIDGNITIGNILAFDTYSLNYVSGIITNIVNNNVYFLNTITGIDIGNNTLNNVFFQSGTNNYVITLNNNLSILGLFTTTGGTINGTYNINVFGGVTVILNGIFAQGTGITTLNLLGGTWSISGTGSIRLNTFINGNLTISGNVYYNTGTLTYTSGTVKANTATLNIGASTTFINCDKINFKTITITAGTTQTFNRFFSGSALVPTRIQSTGANYTIAFQDGFEKITKYTKISNCTLSRSGQLLCITDKSNKGGNVGVRYINQMPNRLPLNSPSTANPLGYAVGQVADPNTILI